MDHAVKIIDEIYSKLSKLRSILRLIDSSDFIESYNSLSKQDREKIDILIRNGSLNELRKWLKKPSTLNCKTLRLIARRLRIKYYSVLTKSELLSEIERARKN